MHSPFFYAETREGQREQEKVKPAHYSQARHLRQVCATDKPCPPAPSCHKHNTRKPHLPALNYRGFCSLLFFDHTGWIAKVRVMLCTTDCLPRFSEAKFSLKLSGMGGMGRPLAKRIAFRGWKGTTRAGFQPVTAPDRAPHHETSSPQPSRSLAGLLRSVPP